jgi:hypothetical protein
MTSVLPAGDYGEIVSPEMKVWSSQRLKVQLNAAAEFIYGHQTVEGVMHFCGRSAIAILVEPLTGSQNLRNGRCSRSMES